MGKFSGGCACGKVRYEIDAAPIVSLQCQCRDCQRASGGGHADALAFPIAAVRITGEVKYYDVTSDRGSKASRGFCPACGSPLTLTTSANPSLRVMTAGSLDDPGAFAPQMVFYARSGHIWDRVDPALPKFDKLPPRG